MKALRYGYLEPGQTGAVGDIAALAGKGTDPLVGRHGPEDNAFILAAGKGLTVRAQCQRKDHGRGRGLPLVLDPTIRDRPLDDAPVLATADQSVAIRGEADGRDGSEFARFRVVPR